MDEELSKKIKTGSIKSIARGISFIENEHPGYENLLKSLSGIDSVNIIGITGPQGAGKSTLTDALIGELIAENRKIAVLCVDPSSPFNLGALLGDRIRMSRWYDHPNVFIRSLATRGSMGGLSPKIIEITDLVASAGFDDVLIETVGVGQSEIEIAGLADTTVVVMVPESGDEIQTMKAGLMEIADVFVINKSDRPDADLFEKNLRLMLAPAFGRHEQEIPIIKTIATEKEGIAELANAIKHNLVLKKDNGRHLSLLTEKAWQLLSRKKMKGVNRLELQARIELEYRLAGFNLYSLIDQF